MLWKWKFKSVKKAHRRWDQQHWIIQTTFGLGFDFLLAASSVLHETNWVSQKPTLKPSSKYQRKYLESFARQLHITSKEDIEKFVFPGLSILINNDLNPHYNAMNPSDPKLNWTMSLSCMLPVTKLPSYHIERTRKEFETKYHSV